MLALLGRAGDCSNLRFFYCSSPGELIREINRAHLRGRIAQLKIHLILLIRRKSASIRDCQPALGLVGLDYLSGQPQRHQLLVGALFGPRPRRIEAASSGNTSANGFALAICSSVNSGL